MGKLIFVKMNAYLNVIIERKLYVFSFSDNTIKWSHLQTYIKWPKAELTKTGA